MCMQWYLQSASQSHLKRRSNNGISFLLLMHTVWHALLPTHPVTLHSSTHRMKLGSRSPLLPLAASKHTRQRSAMQCATRLCFPLILGLLERCGSSHHPFGRDEGNEGPYLDLAGKQGRGSDALVGWDRSRQIDRSVLASATDLA